MQTVKFQTDVSVSIWYMYKEHKLQRHVNFVKNLPPDQQMILRKIQFKSSYTGKHFGMLIL